MLGFEDKPEVNPPLRRFSMLRAAGVDDARAGFSHLLSAYRPTVTPDMNVLADIAAADLGSLSLVYGRTYGGEIGVQLTEQVSYYDVNFALAGHNLLDCGEEQVSLTPRTAGIISPTMRPTMQLSDGYRQLHLRIERHALERHLELLIGSHVVGPIRFQAEMDLTAPALASWTRAVHLLLRDLDDPSGLSAAGPRLSPWADFLMTGLLLAQPHDHSAQLAREAGRALPRPIRFAVALIETEPESDLSLNRLADAAGMGPRSLQRSFRRYLGASPRDYVRSVRLARAHDDLRTGTGATVAEIAFRWGFGHVPRFAHAYQERYGVAPSTTLRESRSATASKD
jgi:AraC-like DNA-binding protein